MSVEFVWVQGLRGPKPEKWSDERIKAQQAYPEKRHVYERHPLSFEYAKMSLDELITIWPAPALPEEEKFNLKEEQLAHETGPPLLA